MFENLVSALQHNKYKKVEDLISKFDTRLENKEVIGKIRAYLAGIHNAPYTPNPDTHRGKEYDLLAYSAITNWLPLIADTYTKSLMVQNINYEDPQAQQQLWSYWQFNNLSALQSLVHRATIEYGRGYVMVLPSRLNYKQITCYSPIRLYARYRILNDIYPKEAVIYRGETEEHEKLYDIVDDKYITSYLKTTKGLKQKDKQAHNLGFVPIIKFTESQSTCDSYGLIAPLIPIQDRINDIVFSISVAIQYASFRQKFAIAADLKCNRHKIATPDKCDGECKITSPFILAPNTMIMSNNPETKFGEFGQTQITDHLDAYVYAVKSLASIAQIPAHLLLGDMSNISVEALAAAESPMQKKINEYEMFFGTAWSQVLALAAQIEGIELNVPPQIAWKDSEVRSLSQIADALGKIATMLEVPKTELWELIPGISSDKLERWKIAKKEQDQMNSLNNILTDENREDNS